MKDQRFGKWLVLTKPNYRFYCDCKCECGSIVSVYKYNLLKGDLNV